ncbi:MAG: alpha/beta hydrolase [Magnetococcales bacterium]|nr:alpha/beta hydrolase [Magnetococcales bacterium]
MSRVSLTSKTLSVLMVSIFVGGVLSGCLGLDRRRAAYDAAREGNFHSQVIKTDFFDLFVSTRFSMPEQPLTIYIEGDGMAWINRYTLSKDPTPRNPLALKLANLDPSPNVAYMGRPCQYVEKFSRRNCKSAYWSKMRFSEEVIESTNQGIDQLKKLARANAINLVGYSGGGAVAVLVAARRDDVVGIRTVAGNLDHVAFTKHHRVTDLAGSLNPLDVAKRVKKISQFHFVGGRDKIVPDSIVSGFIRAEGRGACVKKKSVASMKHADDWDEVWPRLMQLSMPVCQ